MEIKELKVLITLNQLEIEKRRIGKTKDINGKSLNTKKFSSKTYKDTFLVISNYLKKLEIPAGKVTYYRDNDIVYFFFGRENEFFYLQ